MFGSFLPTDCGRGRLSIHFGYPDRGEPVSPAGGQAAGDGPPGPRPHPRLGIVLIALALIGVAGFTRVLAAVGKQTAPPAVNILWAAPFVLMLLAMSVLPALAARLWDRFYAVIAIGLGATAAIGYGVWLQAAGPVAASLGLYLKFMSLVGALFIISSGILVRVRRPAAPAANIAVLLAGAVLANILGTTGAGIVLIRPYLQMNRGHIRPFHVIFFVFLVANIGGALTPLGDPPLLLGYLMGVPFWWMLQHAWGAWLLAVGLPLAVFYLLDRRCPRDAAAGEGQAVAIAGLGQLALILPVLGSLFVPAPWREMVLVLAAGLSLLLTPNSVRVANRLSFKPLREMAVLFLGIFLTLAPVLNLLASRAARGQLTTFTATPGRCYFLTGALSAVLDNAPTYAACLQSRAAAGTVGKDHLTASLPRPAVSPAGTAVLAQPNGGIYLLAISLGAVFFGACTWIGNGPNLLIKSIAEHEGVKCPGFFTYIAGYAVPVLLPVLVLVWLIFLW